MTIRQAPGYVPVSAVHQVIRVIDVTEAGVLDVSFYLLDRRIDPAGLNILRVACIFSRLA